MFQTLWTRSRITSLKHQNKLSHLLWLFPRHALSHPNMFIVFWSFIFVISILLRFWFAQKSFQELKSWCWTLMPVFLLTYNLRVHPSGQLLVQMHQSCPQTSHWQIICRFSIIKPSSLGLSGFPAIDSC